MSELGNAFKNLRGAASQASVAAACGLNVRTIQRAESGGDVRLDTLRALAKHFHLAKADLAALIISWLRMELGEEFNLLDIRTKTNAGKQSDTLTDTSQLVAAYRQIPAKLQRELLRAAQREEVLRSIGPLNDLYDSLKKES
jgi:transcriptional regulator with XRE-family HTH domain